MEVLLLLGNLLVLGGELLSGGIALIKILHSTPRGKNGGS
jgi:hypothetical protein